MQTFFDMLIIVIITSLCCPIAGTFLFVRQMSMVSDSITHTIVLGIVLVYVFTNNLDSPLILLGAVIIGIATYGLSDMLNRTKLIKGDASLGIVFTALFSAAVIIMSLFTTGGALDADVILQGNLQSAAQNRLVFLGIDLGTVSLYKMLFILTVNITLSVLLYKEFFVLSFDPLFAATIGLNVTALTYLLVFAASVTAVGTFNTAGSVLAAALMIGPPATARLLTCRLKKMLTAACGIGLLNGVLGFFIGCTLNVSIAGAIAFCTGLCFLSVLLTKIKFDV